MRVASAQRRAFWPKRWRTCFLAVLGVLLVATAASVRLVRRPTNEKIEGRETTRLAYAIFYSAGQTSSAVQLLSSIYHPRNVYVLHLDEKASDVEKRVLQEVVRPMLPSNVKLMDSSTITWGGISIVLGTLRAIAVLLEHFDSQWDYFINLSASDMPLMPQSQIMHILARMPARSNFMSGAKFDKETAKHQYNRRNGLVLDPSLAVGSQAKRFQSLSDRRESPTEFMPYKGGGWLILHRSFAETSVSLSNIWTGRLLSYFSNWFAADESYFQTLACALWPDRIHHVLKEDWRFIRWTGKVHPDTLKGTEDLIQAFTSGAFFARKFSFPSAERDVLQELVHRHPATFAQHSSSGYQQVRDLHFRLSSIGRGNGSKLDEEDVQGQFSQLEALRMEQSAAMEKRYAYAIATHLCTPDSQVQVQQAERVG